MEYARDAKVSTMEVLKRLVLGGKTTWTPVGWTTNRIRADAIDADKITVRNLVWTHEFQHADDVTTWVRRVRGVNTTAVGSGSFAIGGIETHVWGDRSVTVQTERTDVRGRAACVLGGTSNAINGDRTVAIGTSELTANGSGSTYIGGDMPLTCSAPGLVLLRTPGARVEPDGEGHRIVLAGERGVCSSVDPQSYYTVGPVRVHVGNTIPSGTVHWSVRKAKDENDPPALLLSYKDEHERVFESEVRLTRVS